MAWVNAENLAAVLGYGPQCPSYKFALWILAKQYGGDEKMPFRPVDKGVYRFQALLMTFLLSPSYIVVISHLIGGVKSTSTWVVPLAAAIAGLNNMIGVGLLKS